MPPGRASPYREAMSTRDAEINRDPDLKRDLDAALQTRKELGDSYDAELIDTFLERIEQRIDATVDRRVRRRLAEQQTVLARGGRPAPRGEGQGPGAAFALAALSLVLAIPLSAIASAQAGLPGLLLCWTGITGVNFCFAGGRLFRRGNGRDREGEGAWE